MKNSICTKQQQQNHQMKNKKYASIDFAFIEIPKLDLDIFNDR